MNKQSITKQSLAKLALSGMMVGGLILTGCEKSATAPKTEVTKPGITAASTLAVFKTECAALNGTFAMHECNGQNTCKGHSFQEGKAVKTHTCKGNASCNGGSCLEA